MSQITGDLLIALSKQLPRVFSEIDCDVIWSINSLEKEPTVSGEIYNIDVSISRLENVSVPFQLTETILDRWNHKLLREHAAKFNNQGMMMGSVDVNEKVKIRIERMTSYDQFKVTQVSTSYAKSNPDSYRFQYISAGLGSKASGYPEFDSRHEDIIDVVNDNVQVLLQNKLPVSVYQLMKIEVTNNWLDSSTFDPLGKSSVNYEDALTTIKKMIEDLDSNFDVYQNIARKEIVNNKEYSQAIEEGRNAISPERLEYILQNGTNPVYERTLKLTSQLQGKVSRIRHNEAAQAVKLLSQSLISSVFTQINELKMFDYDLATSVGASAKAERQDTLIATMENAQSRLQSSIDMLIKLKEAYEMFIKAGNDAE